MSDPYQYWKDALAGKKPKCFVDSPECGFYRKGIYETQPLKNGQGSRPKRVGWSPVAIFTMGDKSLCTVVGVGSSAKMIADRDRINDLWSHVAANPIKEETYRAVAERGEPWPDSHETVKSIPADNSSAAIEAVSSGAVVTARAPDAVISDEIDKALGQLTAYANIESDEQSSKARSLQQKFLDLRGEAEKHYNALNRPLLDEQKRIRAIWFPLRDSADAASDTLRKAMGRWEDTKRAAAKVAAERQEAGQDNAASNVPPPSTQIRGGAGRAVSVSVEKVVTAIDVDKVFEQFKTAPQVVELLTVLAQKAIRSGIDVPGATFEERSVVR